MNGKSLYTIFVVIIYVVLISVYIFIAKQNDFCSNDNNLCVRFCSTDAKKFSDEFFKENFVTEYNQDYLILRGIPKCHGGVQNITEFEGTDDFLSCNNVSVC